MDIQEQEVLELRDTLAILDRDIAVTQDSVELARQDIQDSVLRAVTLDSVQYRDIQDFADCQGTQGSAELRVLRVEQERVDLAVTQVTADFRVHLVIQDFPA